MALEAIDCYHHQWSGPAESVQTAKLRQKYARSVDLEALDKKVDRLTKMVEELKGKLEST